jgi:hypothetical protein
MSAIDPFRALALQAFLRWSPTDAGRLYLRQRNLRCLKHILQARRLSAAFWRLAAGELQA